MQIKFSTISYKGMPFNYGVVDDILSRSAQPRKDDIAWLKSQGITDVINFRTSDHLRVSYNEKEEVEKFGMHYHWIPSITVSPSEDNIKTFLSKVDEIAKNGGKAHIHCMAGADRTGMYTFIYKMIKGIGTLKENETEWINRGLHYHRYPNLMNQTKEIVKKMLNKKSL